MQVASQIETERGISKEILFSAIEQSLIAAYSKRFSGVEVNVECLLKPESGEAIIYHLKEVTKTVEDENLQITKKEAKILDPGVKMGDTLKIEVKLPGFGRIAAQTAKQVIAQRLREAEKNSVYDEFQSKIGKIITGTVQQVEERYCLINLGRIEAILPLREQVQNEHFQPNEKIKVYIVDIEKSNRGNQIYISRTHPGLLRCLFEQEIPEIQEGIIEIKAVSRDAGKRAKVAVKTNNQSISAVGTCVGQMGGRIQSIIKEVGAEKIDVLEWDEEPTKFIANSLKPAKITQVIIDDPEEREATVVVPHDQLSLAIGKAGINVRLSINLTEWKLNIVSEADYDGSPSKPGLSLVEKLKIEKEKQKQEEKAQEDAQNKAEEDAKNQEEDQDNQSKVPENTEPELIEANDLAVMLNLSIDELIKQAVKHGVKIENAEDQLTSEQVEVIKEKMAN
jgi:N utilization substance protein A